MSAEVTVLREPSAHTLAELAALASGPLEAAGAERAIVFGSYARGSADAWSDLDLVVVMETDLPRPDRWRELRGLLDALPVPIDLLVYRPDELDEGARRGLGIFDALAREGATIYERRPR